MRLVLLDLPVDLCSHLELFPLVELLSYNEYVGPWIVGLNASENTQTANPILHQTLALNFDPI